MNEEIKNSLSYFDRAIGSLHGLPDVVSSKPTTLRVVPTFGLGSHTYIVQTFRQREIGDSIFLEVTSDGNATRIVIPPAVADTIARQREQLTSKSRSRAGKRVAEDLKARGIKPGFMKKAKGGAKALLVALAIASALTAPARAFNTSKNPDVSPSIGWGVHGGRLAGILQNDAAYTEWAMDARLPVTNCLTLTVDFAQTTVSNAAPGVSTDSNRIGASVRVYLRDFLGD